MKYLYLILRHLFPRKRWKTVKEIRVFDTPEGGSLPWRIDYVMEDQFGNRKTVKGATTL